MIALDPFSPWSVRKKKDGQLSEGRGREDEGNETHKERLECEEPTSRTLEPSLRKKKEGDECGLSKIRRLKRRASLVTVELGTTMRVGKAGRHEDEDGSARSSSRSPRFDSREWTYCCTAFRELQRERRFEPVRSRVEGGPISSRGDATRRASGRMREETHRLSQTHIISEDARLELPPLVGKPIDSVELRK